MSNRVISNIRYSLVSKLILCVGITLFISVSIWSYSNIKYQKEKSMRHILATADKLSNTIMLGTHYAMMQNSRDDINQIINNIAKQKDIENIRIYNKEGQIKFSNRISEVEMVTNIKDEACYICHRSEPPLTSLNLSERTRFFSDQKVQLLGLITSIDNEPGCSSQCHVHPTGKHVLGALDLVISLKEIDDENISYQRGIIMLAFVSFLLISAIIYLLMFRFLKQPIKMLIEETNLIAKGNYYADVGIKSEDEIGQLAEAIKRMGNEIGEKQAELNRKKDEYQKLFELVPCYITVQDKNYSLIQYNRLFSENFNPEIGNKCFVAYKGRTEKCVNCPVEKTFIDGESHYSEETGINRDGTVTHWMVVTSSIEDNDGNIVAAMELGLDITHRKLLEEKLERSEKKYHAIFSNIPNPVFVADEDSLQILDCNESVEYVYGFNRYELIDTSFLDLFKSEDKEHIRSVIKTSDEITKQKQINKEKKSLFVNIRVSPTEYNGERVLLITTSDITKRLEAEQQLIQASKMATLGEMATGIAHELNQPLSVIKTASSYFMKKIRKHEPIKDEILFTMSTEIDSHVDRATRIINHLREFGRKTEMDMSDVQVNDILKKAFEMFSQQLKLRGIEVIWDIETDLPLIKANSSRLEQVFINLLINARDAIESRWEMFSQKGSSDVPELSKKIFIRTCSMNNEVTVEVRDTGVGITKEVLDKIFEPFFTTKTVGKGTGLGLSISYGIVKECGGTIDAVSTVGEGTCFILKFPVSSL